MKKLYKKVKELSRKPTKDEILQRKAEEITSNILDIHGYEEGVYFIDKINLILKEKIAHKREVHKQQTIRYEKLLKQIENEKQNSKSY